MNIRWNLAIGAFAVTASVATAYAQQAVILVRHAELEGAAMAEPKALPLSEAGEARAKRLASMLKDAGIGAIYVTDFVRTNKTAEPLSRELGKENCCRGKECETDIEQAARRLRCK